MKTLITSFSLLPLLLLGCSLFNPTQDNKMTDEEALGAPVKAKPVNPAIPVPKIFAVCSDSKPRTIEVIVEWPKTLTSFENIRLDVSNHKKGFIQNKYAVLWPIEKSKKMRLVTDELRREPGLLAELEMDLVETKRGTGTEHAMLRLQGLEPGRVYYWRVLELKGREWASEQIIRDRHSDMCIADLIDDD